MDTVVDGRASCRPQTTDAALVVYIYDTLHRIKQAIVPSSPFNLHGHDKVSPTVLPLLQMLIC